MILLNEKLKEEIKRLFNIKIKDSSIKEIKEIIFKEINIILFNELKEIKNKSIKEALEIIEEKYHIVYLNTNLKLYKENNIRNIDDSLIINIKHKIIKEKYISISDDFSLLSLKRITNYIVANEIKKIIINDIKSNEPIYKNILNPLYNICSCYIRDNDKIGDINVETLKIPFANIGLHIMLYTNNNIKFYIKKSKKIDEFLKNPNYELIKKEDIYQISVKIIKEFNKDLLYLAEPNKEIINDFFDKIENIYKNYNGEK